MAASYFDVDGTLVSTNLVHPTLYYMLRQQTPAHSLAKLGNALAKAPLMALAEMRDRRLFNEMLFASYGGMSEDRLMTLSEEAFQRVMKPALFRGAKELVQTCLDRGHDVVLVSGALELKDRFATGKLLRPVVAGPEKAGLIRDHAKKHGHDLESCFAYSDSYSDVPMLSIVGNPAAINPDSRLRTLAKTYSWPIIELAKPSLPSLLARI
jgi:phosphoserine phosphatase